MTVDPSFKKAVLEQAGGAAALHVAYVGVARGLFDALAERALVPAELAGRTGSDAGYLAAWCDAAYAFGYLDEAAGSFALTAHGRAFVRSEPGSLFAVPVGAVLGAHMAERAAFYAASGERPGEGVLAERETILPLFGPMLEQNFAAMFAGEVSDAVPVFAELDRGHGTAVDLGCGNGWYLRALARRFPGLRGIGLDGFEENVAQAKRLADAQGLGERLSFRSGDLRNFTVEEPVELIAMNRALHHVWEAGRREIFERLRDHLRPGGAAVIWEPAWPAERATLRSPAYRMMAVQNLSEHVQGNHFLRPDEIEAAFVEVGMSATTYRFREGSEAVVVGRRG
ncbi:MAG: methyltransferase domain-containing protein [Myxococcales bacterium]|nr:methyltransferase domain-containing protein [Myxococcales bacterium]